MSQAIQLAPTLKAPQAAGDLNPSEFTAELPATIQYPDPCRYPNRVLRENYALLRAYLDSLQKDAEPAAKIAAARSALQHALLAAGQSPFRALDFAEWRRRLQATRRLDGRPDLLSESRVDGIFDFMRPFCRWLIKHHPAAFKHWDADKLGNIAIRADAPAFRASRRRPVVTLEMALQIAALDTNGDVLLMRDQAVACLHWASGARVESIATLPLKAITRAGDTLRIAMDPKLGVKTKGSKVIQTTLLPIPPLLRRVTDFLDWLDAHGASGDGMFFNEILVDLDADPSAAASNAPPAPTRAHTLAKRMQKLYAALGWRGMSGTHGFRRGHITYALACATTIQNSLAVCHNVGHSFLNTTVSYNEQTDQDRAALIGQFTPERFQRLNASPAVSQPGLRIATPANAQGALEMIEAHIRATTTNPTVLKHLLRDLEGLRDSLE